jgi:hypothetical protein
MTNGKPLNIVIPDALFARLDTYRASQEIKPSRPIRSD